MKPLLYVLVITNLSCFSQVLLEADGKTETHTLISDAFAPGYKPIESPGFKKNKCDNHSDYSEEHITQVYDSILKKFVFKFVIHVKEDNDRCKKFDRQRNEIKGYRHSPDNMKANLGETVTYEWKLKIAEDFAPSKRFTHLHQIKSVDENPRCKPIFTLSAKKGKTDDYFLLRHSKGKTSETLAQIDLDLFRGTWVNVTEIISYNKSNKGQYSLLITNSITQQTILDFKKPSIKTWNEGASFVRPKWGIYRSLLDASNLKDEEVLFADFKIQKDSQ